MRRRPILRRVGKLSVWISTAGAVLFATFLAGRATVVGPELPVSVVEIPTVPVAERTLGRSIRVPLRVGWTAIGLPSPRSGTITALADPSIEIHEGELIAEIDLLPLYAIEGDVPLSRSLAPGTKGRDVSTLQSFLSRVGVLPSEEIDGEYGSSTSTAVRAWQRTNGLPVTGRVEAGTFVVVPSFPTLLRLPEKVGVGRLIDQGADLVEIVDPLPTMTASLLDTQQQLLPDPPFVVTVTAEDLELTFAGIRVEASTEDDSRVLIVDPAPYADCDAECRATIPQGTDLLVNAEIEVIPETTGLAVPVTALIANGDGTLSVTLDDGTSKPVELVIQDGSHAIVTGLAAGEMIRVYGG